MTASSHKPDQPPPSPRALRRGPVQPPPQACPVCGHPMPDLRGGTLSVCRNCGHKDDCC